MKTKRIIVIVSLTIASLLIGIAAEVDLCNTDLRINEFTPPNKKCLEVGSDCTYTQWDPPLCECIYPINAPKSWNMCWPIPKYPRQYDLYAGTCALDESGVNACLDEVWIDGPFTDNTKNNDQLLECMRYAHRHQHLNQSLIVQANMAQ